MKSIVMSMVFGSCLSAASLNAEVIYDNSQRDLLIRFNPAGLEVGDEIFFDGTARYLTGFSFEYWGTSITPGAFAGPVKARVRFYSNDGPSVSGYACPGGAIYDSDWFPIVPTYNPNPDFNGRATLNFEAGMDAFPFNLHLPNSMTFSIQFKDLGAGDAAGIDIFSPPSVGTSYLDYWQYDNGAWALLGNSAGPMDFAARFEASATPIPEPSVLGLLFGGSFCLAAGFRRK